MMWALAGGAFSKERWTMQGAEQGSWQLSTEGNLVSDGLKQKRVIQAQEPYGYYLYL